MTLLVHIKGVVQVEMDKHFLISLLLLLFLTLLSLEMLDILMLVLLLVSLSLELIIPMII